MLSRSLFAAFALGAVLTSATAWIEPAAAQSSGLAGSWSGGGRVVFEGGQSERASCRASFLRQSSNRYFMSATCATASARVSQTATVGRISGSRYYGRFFNEEFGISGTLRISVSGNRLNATLKGDTGSAVLSLRRR